MPNPQRLLRVPFDRARHTDSCLDLAGIPPPERFFAIDARELPPRVEPSLQVHQRLGQTEAPIASRAQVREGQHLVGGRIDLPNDRNPSVLHRDPLDGAAIQVPAVDADIQHIDPVQKPIDVGRRRRIV